ncbi:MAG: Rrf2 family transcriptional regulator [Spirochaetes bacterium]|nr:MAG: Rrf2 family transcriptional regulator [Spirochaetota bacterium]
MRLSTKSEYACLAIIDLAENYHKNPRLTIAEIARHKDIPKKYLEQILLILKRGGYVTSYKGAEGGYTLAKKPEDISIAEIIRLMDGALAPVESVSKYFFKHTPVERSPELLSLLKEIRDYISDKLERTTFADLI